MLQQILCPKCHRRLGQIAPGHYACVVCHKTYRAAAPPAPAPAAAPLAPTPAPAQLQNMRRCVLCKGEFMPEQVVDCGDGSSVCHNCRAVAAAIGPSQPSPAEAAMVAGRAPCALCEDTFAIDDLVFDGGQMICNGCMLKRAAAARSRTARVRRRARGSGGLWAGIAAAALIAGAAGFYFARQHPGSAVQSAGIPAPAPPKFNSEKLYALLREANALVRTKEYEKAIEKHDQILWMAAAADPGDRALLETVEQVRHARAAAVAAAERRRTVAWRPTTTPLVVPSLAPTDVAMPQPLTSAERVLPPLRTPASPNPRIDPPIASPQPGITPVPEAGRQAPTTSPVALASKASVALVVTTRPTTTHSREELAAAANKRIEQLVTVASAALVGRDQQAALEALLDARAVLNRRHGPVPAELESALQHQLAVVYMRQSKFDRARQPLLRAYELSPKDRTVVTNYAVAEVVQKVTVMHGARLLKEYFVDHADELDEPTLNLLGTALARSTTSNLTPVAQRLLDDGWALYQVGCGRLEQSRPGQKRWGIEWKPAGVAEALRARKDAAIARYQPLAAEAEGARIEMEKARQILVQQQNWARIGRGGNVSSASAAFAMAESRYNFARQAADRAAAAIPSEPWLERFEPVVPIAALAMAAPSKPAEAAPARVAVNASPRPVNRSPRPVRPEPASAEETPAAEDPAPAVAVAASAAPRRPEKLTITRYAAAFPIRSDLLLSAAAPLGSATKVMVEVAGNVPFEAKVIRKDAAANLALLEVTEKKMPYYNIAESFTGGDVRCIGFPTVSTFDPEHELIVGRATAPTGAWRIALPRSPRLAGCPVIDTGGNIVGMAVPERDAETTATAAISLGAIRTFCSDSLPSARSAVAPDFAVHITASFEVEE